MGAREVGRVVALWRYPVKSMAAEPLQEIDVSWAGFAGDRRWAFVRGDIPRSGFPWMTIREKASMVKHVSTHAIADLEALVGASLDPQRFRPNLLVEASEREEAWIGSTLRIGGMAMRADQPDERCVVINVDPATGERDAAVLRTLARERSACIGIYGSTVQPGRVAVGDPVLLGG